LFEILLVEAVTSVAMVIIQVWQVGGGRDDGKSSGEGRPEVDEINRGFSKYIPA
jgi:hypothetical protein